MVATADVTSVPHMPNRLSLLLHGLFKQHLAMPQMPEASALNNDAPSDAPSDDQRTINSSTINSSPPADSNCDISPHMHAASEILLSKLRSDSDGYCAALPNIIELASYFNGGNEGDMLINKDSNPPEEFIL